MIVFFVKKSSSLLGLLLGGLHVLSICGACFGLCEVTRVVTVEMLTVESQSYQHQQVDMVPQSLCK